MARNLVIWLLILVWVLTNGLGKSSSSSNEGKKSDSPVAAVASFWKAAFSSDMVKIRELATSTPESFFSRCAPKPTFSDLGGTRELGVISETPTNLFNQSSGTQRALPATNPEAGTFDGATRDLRLDLVLPTAEMINASRISPDIISINTVSVYGEEAIVIVDYKLSQGANSRTVFFLHKSDSWRIFMAVQPNSVLITNENYAHSRPKC